MWRSPSCTYMHFLPMRKNNCLFLQQRKANAKFRESFKRNFRRGPSKLVIRNCVNTNCKESQWCWWKILGVRCKGYHNLYINFAYQLGGRVRSLTLSYAVSVVFWDLNMTQNLQVILLWLMIRWLICTGVQDYFPWGSHVPKQVSRKGAYYVPQW